MHLCPADLRKRACSFFAVATTLCFACGASSGPASGDDDGWTDEMPYSLFPLDAGTPVRPPSAADLFHGDSVMPSTTRTHYGSSWFEVRISHDEIVLRAGALGAETAEVVARTRDEFHGIHDSLIYSIGDGVRCGDEIVLAVSVYLDGHAAVEAWDEQLWLLSAPAYTGRGTPAIRGPVPIAGHQHVGAGSSVDWGGEVFVGPGCDVQFWPVDGDLGVRQLEQEDLEGWRLAWGAADHCLPDTATGRGLYLDSVWTVYRCDGLSTRRPANPGLAQPAPGEPAVPANCAVQSKLGFLDDEDRFEGFPSSSDLHQSFEVVDCFWVVR